MVRLVCWKLSHSLWLRYFQSKFPPITALAELVVISCCLTADLFPNKATWLTKGKYEGKSDYKQHETLLCLSLLTRTEVVSISNPATSTEHIQSADSEFYRGINKMIPTRTSYAALMIIFHAPLAYYCMSIKQSAPEQHIIQGTAQAPSIEVQAKRASRLDDTRRPIWNLAHMVNSIKELDYRLAKGANAIEADVTFSKEGEPLYMYHGPPCDCWRHCHQQEDFNDYLIYLNEITSNLNADSIGRNLSLLILDLKLETVEHPAKIRAGKLLAQSLRDNLFFYPHLSTGSDSQTEVNFSTPLKVVLSISHVTDMDLVHNFIHELESTNSSVILRRIGFDVGMNDDLQQIEQMWHKHGKTLNLWQGDGYTNCISPFYNLGRLFKALAKRNDPSGYPKKVYHWTIDLHDRIRESLRFGVDAIITNHPERLVSILNEPDMAHNFRLATREDDPFRKFISIDGRTHETARFQRSASTTGGGFFAGVMDVIYSWVAYIREIPMLSLPTTSRFLPKVKRHRQAVTTVVRTKNQQIELRTDNRTSIESLGSATTSADEDTTTVSPQNATSSTQSDEYLGPKWYTKLAANMLVAVLKLVLPVEP